jgi:hypothetical protein
MRPASNRVFSSVLLGLCAGILPAGAGDGIRPVEFNRDIRPIITENCFACHGPDKNQRKAKLRLDDRQVAIERGAIVPGKPGASKLVEHIKSGDPDEIMPPPKTHKTLTTAQKQLLIDWVAEGAEYEPHWAYMPLKRPRMPQTRDAGWAQNPIDSFVLSRLETSGIRPSREAEKPVLLRRLSLDLTGLPPTPQELDAFLADTRPGAYERQVERLLNSPHFGERMAVPWLDLVRYADTVGYHGDQNQDVFPYRDYVIDSFNQNKSFDQFTVEQIAGDLLPNPTVEQRVATCFNRLNMMTREGGAQPKEYLAKYAADRVRTVSMAWLGSTMGCAECHDHKYDPFTSKDFYQMEAFFADIQQWGVYMDYDYTPNPDLRGFSNDHPFPPELEVESPYLAARIARLHSQEKAIYGEAAKALVQQPADRAAWKTWRQASLQFLRQWPSGWAFPTPGVTLRMKDTNAVATTNFSLRTEGWVALTREPKETLRFTLPLSNLWVAALRLEVATFPSSDEKESAQKKRRAGSVAPVALLKNGDDVAEKKLSFYFGEADYKQERYANGRSIIGVTDRWTLSKDHERQTAVWLLDKPVQLAAGATLAVDLGSLAVASVRVSVSPFAAAEPLDSGIGQPLRQAVSRPLPLESKAHRELDGQTHLLSTHWDAGRVKQLRNLQNEIRQCRCGKAWVMVTEQREPYPMRVLRRGNWQDEGGDSVQPQVPHFLPQVETSDDRRLTRLDLAQWLVSSQNPLTSRAVMNRLWKQFFGTGISAVVDDLGAQGEWPVHPELLDWLASEFLRPTPSTADGLQPESAAFPWDVKHMVRLLVRSATYRQDSNERPELREVDPNNRLLAFETPRRLEAEFVRDNALAIAGLLDGECGGPSAFPYQPAGYYAYLQFPDRSYDPNPDDRQYRRGVYTHWQRTFLQPMLANFDAPSREECTANRVVSDTPQQALTLLNDPTFVEAARIFASRLLQQGPSTAGEKIDAAFRRALARLPKDSEKQSLLNFLDLQRAHYRENLEESGKLMLVGNAPPGPNSDPAELAAWTQVCRVILNLHETITRY